MVSKEFFNKDNLVLWCVLVTQLFLLKPLSSGDFTSYISRSDYDNDWVHIENRYESETRKVISLNGTWSAKASESGSVIPVVVPGALETDQDLEFSRSFTLDSSYADYAVHLFAFGIANKCRILVNDEFITSHSNGYTSFNVDLTGSVSFKSPNNIKVIIESKLDARYSLPLLHCPGMPKQYAGIYRDIFLLLIPRVGISDVIVTPRFENNFNSCELSVKATVRNLNYGLSSVSDFRLQTELVHLESGQRVARSSSESVTMSGRSSQLLLKITVGTVEPWTPENPDLYTLRLRLLNGNKLADQRELTIGLKQLQVRDGQFYLNGSSYSFHGVEWIEHFPDKGSCSSWQLLSSDIKQMKSIGVNAIRVIGGSPHPFLPQLCDEIGVFLFQELPLSAVPAARIQDPAFFEMALNAFEEMLERDSHHAAIAGWGLGVDLQTGAAFDEFYRLFSETAKTYSGQPVYCSYKFLRPNFSGQQTQAYLSHFSISDARPEVLQQFTDYIELSKQGVLLSAGYPLEPASTTKNSASDTRTRDIVLQEIQAYRLNRLLRTSTLQQRDNGIFIDTFADWPGQRILIPYADVRYPGLNRTGIADINRKSRISSDVVASSFLERKPLRMSVQIPEVKSPYIFPVAGLAFVLLFLFNFNRDRRLRGNLRRIFIYPQGFYSELRDNRKIAVWHTILFCIIMCGNLAIVICSVLYNFRQNMIFDSIVNLVIHSDEMKIKLAWLIWHPVAAIPIIAVLIFLVLGSVIIGLRFIAFLLGLNRNLLQFFTLVYWCGAAFVWTLPLAPIFYRIINQTQWTGVAVLFILVMLAWFLIRLFRGVQVMLTLPSLKALLLGLVITTSIVGGIVWYYDVQYALFDYTSFYWQVIQQNGGIL